MDFSMSKFANKVDRDAAEAAHIAGSAVGYPTLTGLSFTEECADATSDFSGSHTVRAPGNSFPLAVLSNYHGGEREAYARLFAAAPDLLECARLAKEFEQHAGGTHLPARAWFELHEKLSAAIAKATGA